MTTLTKLSVTGMTCAHCVKAVTDELTQVDGVKRVAVSLQNGGVSTVAVHSANPLDASALREAVEEAGYELTNIDVLQDALAATVLRRVEQYKTSGHSDDKVAALLAEEVSAAETGKAAGQGGCGCGGCGCGGRGRRGLGIGLPIVPKS